MDYAALTRESLDRVAARKPLIHPDRLSGLY